MGFFTKYKAGDRVQIKTASGYNEICKVKIQNGSPVATSKCGVFQFELNKISRLTYSVKKV